MKLKIRDMEAVEDKVAETEYLDLLDIFVELGEENDNQLSQWVYPIHLDDEGNPDPEIATRVREYGINVDQVLSEEVTSSSGGDSWDMPMRGEGYRSRTNFNLDDHIRGIGNEENVDDDANKNCDNDDGDGDGDDDDDDNDDDDDGGNNYAFTQRNDTDTYCTQDEDHGCRVAGLGIGATGKDYTRRTHKMQLGMSSANKDNLSITLESMSLRTTDDGYGGFGISNYPYAQFPIYGQMVGRNQEAYSWHVRDYIENYSKFISWYQYCLNQDASYTMYEPPRTSFWY